VKDTACIREGEIKIYCFGSSQILLAHCSDKGSLGKSTVLGREWGNLLDKFKFTCTETSELTSQKTKSMHIVKTN
jgi:hypothetical protein